MPVTAATLLAATATPETVASDDPATAVPALVAAGNSNDGSYRDAVISQLGAKDPIGRSAAWAAAGLCDAATLQGAASGKTRQRRNAALALAIQTARALQHGDDPHASVTAALALLRAEIATAQDGGTAAGEMAGYAPALAQHQDLPALLDDLVAADRYADRFEIERLGKIHADGDNALKKDLAADAATFLTDQLIADEDAAEDEAEPSVEDAGLAAPEPEVPAPFADEPAPHHSEEQPLDEAAEQATAEDEAAAAAAAAAMALPWEDVAADPRLAALGEQMPQLIGQIGPLLTQVAAQAAGKDLLSCSPDEIAGIYLQVLPQVLPPQYVQAALSPDALTVVQVAATVLTELGHSADDLVAGIGVVREAMREQIRASGMLGGPDYSDPDPSLYKTDTAE